MKYDIIIVGAGPAGISTALHLAKFSPELARRILVLERGVHPRPKLCAGGILQDGEFILRRLGLDPAEVQKNSVDEAFFLFDGKGINMKRFPYSFWIVAREEFDAWLVKEARARGIRVEEEICVQKVVPGKDGVKVETDKGEYYCQVVVGADGSNSIVRRAIADKQNDNSSMTIEFFSLPEEAQAGKPKRGDQAYFEFGLIGDGVQGYVWDFPTKDGESQARIRGIFHSRMHKKASEPNLKNKLKARLAHEGIQLENYEIKGLPIRWFNPKNTFAAERVILVGDAAGVDPTYGEGISFALGYGELAAAEICQAYVKNEFSFSGYKKRILSHPMGRSLKRRLRLARMLYRFSNRKLQRFIWWRLGFILKWYIDNFLFDWAKYDELPTDSKKGNSVNL